MKKKKIKELSLSLKSLALKIVNWLVFMKCIHKQQLILDSTNCLRISDIKRQTQIVSSISIFEESLWSEALKVWRYQIDLFEMEINVICFSNGFGQCINNMLPVLLMV